MRSSLLVLVLAVAAPSVACAEPVVFTRAKECLKANVDSVASSSNDPKAAADFLLSYSCANEVFRATRFEVNSYLLETFKTAASIPRAIAASGAPAATAGGTAANAANTLVDVSVSEETGEVKFPPRAAGSPAIQPFTSILRGVGSASSQFSTTTAPVLLRAYTSELVMAAFLRRTAHPR